MRHRCVLLLIVVLAFACAPMWAGSITFNFNDCSEITSLIPGTCPGNLGTTVATYKVGGLTVTASGYLNSTSTNNLYVKNDGIPENGLGLNGTTSNEINSGQYIYLNMLNLLSSGITSGTLWLGSVQSGEAGKVCQTSAAGTPGTANCVTYTGNSGASISNMVSWSSTDPFLSITATSGNVLVGQQLQVATVPEPGTLLLLGAALLAMVFLLHRRRPSEASS